MLLYFFKMPLLVIVPHKFVLIVIKFIVALQSGHLFSIFVSFLLLFVPPYLQDAKEKEHQPSTTTCSQTPAAASGSPVSSFVSVRRARLRRDQL